MPRVLPSEVVAIIDQMTAGAGWNLEANPNVLLEQGHLGTVATLLGLAEQVPKELLVISGEKYLGLLAAMSALRAAIGAWQVENRYRIGMLPGFGQVHVLMCVQQRLARSVGGSPTGVRARRPVAWMVRERETQP